MVVKVFLFMSLSTFGIYKNRFVLMENLNGEIVLVSMENSPERERQIAQHVKFAFPSRARLFRMSSLTRLFIAFVCVRQILRMWVSGGERRLEASAPHALTPISFSLSEKRSLTPSTLPCPNDR